MKIAVQLPLLALGGALLLPAPSTQAQTTNLPPREAGAFSAASEVSVSALVQLQSSQIERLNRLYDGYATRRGSQEANLARLQTQLAQAQSPTAFDEKKAARLLRETADARQKVMGDFLATRSRALQVLQPVQRAQLESISTDPRFHIRRDAFFELLLQPVEALGASGFAPLPSANYSAPYPQRRTDNSGANPGSGNYGVYGGYGGGRPQIGVYGGYGIGGVGVYGGIGRGGPSIGIGIGGLFGGRGRRW